MGTTKRQIGLAFWIVALVGSAVGVVSVLAVAPAAANHHTFDEAPNLDEKGNFTVTFPYTTDHYPGDQNEENGSIEYSATGSEAYRSQGAEAGLWIDTVIVRADWIDYSACETGNTGAFGIDRGNNNSGTQTDNSLLEHRLDTDFRDDGMNIYFYDWDDFAGDPPYLAPEDAIVAAQGKEEGPCLTVTSEPGWYQVQGFVNGTVAEEDCTEEGNSECQPEEEEAVGVRMKSNYIYVCQCDSEQEAREDLGAPPNEAGATATPESETPTPTPTSTPTEDGDAGTATPTETSPPDAGTATPTDTPTPTDTDGGGGDNGDTGGDDSGGDSVENDTPTVGGGPGFTPVLAVLALLGAALLALRRR